MPAASDSRSRGWQSPRDRRGRRAADWMAEATRAPALLLADLRGDVVHNIIRTTRVAAHTRRHVIEAERAAGAPGDVVVGTRAVATDTDSTDQNVRGVVQRKSPAEYINTPNAVTNHRVIRLAKVRGWSVV